MLADFDQQGVFTVDFARQQALAAGRAGGV